MPRPFCQALAAIAGVALVATACGSSPRAAPGTSSGQAALVAPPPLAQRVASLDTRRGAVLRAIQLEDSPRNGRAKVLTVFAQVQGAAALTEARAPQEPLREADVLAYENACAELEAAYLGSLLESTDAPAAHGEWASDEGRDVLGSATVAARLAAWQSEDASRPFAKFAVVRAADGQLRVRVGSLKVGHVDIAGGLALSAGLLQTDVKEGKTRVVLLENTSGGFRPGPLRNVITLRALRAAGYLPAKAGELTVHDNPSGSYEHSKLIPPKH